jgi:hypothetical protein
VSKNVCGACGVDFSLLEQFDTHRGTWRINKRTQELQGHCTDPRTMGLVEFKGVWFSPKGHEQAVRMSKLGSRPR